MIRILLTSLVVATSIAGIPEKVIAMDTGSIPKTIHISNRTPDLDIDCVTVDKQGTPTNESKAGGVFLGSFFSRLSPQHSAVINLDKSTVAEDKNPSMIVCHGNLKSGKKLEATFQLDQAKSKNILDLTVAIDRLAVPPYTTGLTLAPSLEGKRAPQEEF